MDADSYSLSYRLATAKDEADMDVWGHNSLSEQKGAPTMEGIGVVTMFQILSV